MKQFFIILCILAILVLIQLLNRESFTTYNNVEYSNKLTIKDIKDLKKEQFASNKKMLKFIHITKTGGTSIEDIGLKHGIKWGRFDTETHKHVNKTEFNGMPWHYPFTLLDKKYKQKYDWFVVVRNPYDRVLSENYCPWNKIKKTNNIKEFNDILYKHILKLENGYKLDHFQPMYKYFDKSVKIHVLKFENLKKDFDSLMKKYNLDIKLDLHTNKGHNKFFSIDDFSPKLVKLINKVYDKDFKQFGYKKLYTPY